MLAAPKSLTRSAAALAARLALAATLLLVASCSTHKTPKLKPNVRLAPAPYYDDATGIYFPGAIGTLHRLPIVHLEDKTPGLGLAISYRDTEAKIDIFVYDLQASVIPVGIDAPVIQDSFESAIKDIERAAQKGIYTNYQLLERNEITLGQVQFLHARMTYGENLLLRDAHLLVAGVNGQILKIRSNVAQPSDLDVWQAFGHIANTIAQSWRNGYSGLDSQQIEVIEAQLEEIDLSDGLQTNETIAIGQIELVHQKLHNRFDPETGEVAPTPGERATVRFHAYPTIPPRVAPRFVEFAIDDDGNAELLEQAESP